MEVTLKLDQDVRNKFRHVVRVGFDEGAETENAGVEAGQVTFGLQLGSLQKLVGLAPVHLRPDLGPEVAEEPLLGLGVQELGVDEAAEDLGRLLSDLRRNKHRKQSIQVLFNTSSSNDMID